MMTLSPNDIHFVIDAERGRLKCYVYGGALRWTVPARCYGANGGQDAIGGDTPGGLYRMGTPERIPDTDPDINAFGRWFVDLVEQQDQERSRGRAGIGFHGGGSGLAAPLAPYQGWQVTHGCVRLQNADLQRAVDSILYTQKHGGTAWLTVVW